MSDKIFGSTIVAIVVMVLAMMAIFAFVPRPAATVSPYDRRKAAEERLANLLDVTYQQGVIDGRKQGCKP